MHSLDGVFLRVVEWNFKREKSTRKSRPESDGSEVRRTADPPEDRIMSRRTFAIVALLTAPLVGLEPAAEAVNFRDASRFVQGLRERGYYDLASEFLERLRQDPATPADLRATVDYELGRLLLDEASKTGDLVHRKDMLDRARGKLDAFTTANPGHPLAAEALVQLARLLVERGHLAMLLSEETQVKAEKEPKIAEARTSFDQARVAYTRAEERLQKAYKPLVGFIPEDDPRKEERDRTHNALMDAQLQKAVVDFEQAHTHPPGSTQRVEMLDKSRAQFQELHNRYRTQLAGLAAQMWQGKCFEEKGDLGAAMGLFNQLMEHDDAHLKSLQRHVGFFRIIVIGKRKEYALAADEAVRWLQANNSVALRRSREGLGVQLELARNILAQLDEATRPSDREAAIRRATDVLGEVVRYPSPYKADALALLKVHKPRAALNASAVEKLSYEEAITQSDQAMSAHDWGRAIALLRVAVRLADPSRDPDKANLARYNMAFCCYMDKRFYEAAVLAEHLARRYPRGGLSAKATEIGMASLADAYNHYLEGDRSSDLNRLIALASYTIETWPDSEPGDAARMTLGQIRQGMGQYPKAVEVYESVRPNSSKRLDARTRAGASHWQQSLALRQKGKTPEADAEVQQAVDVLKETHKARQAAGAAVTDPGLIGNACDLADIYLGTGKADESLVLLDPLAKAAAAPENADRTSPAFKRLISSILRAHIATNHVDLAMADMATLEAAGTTGAGLTQLYYSLGKLLQAEIEGLRKKGDAARLAQTQDAYRKFLTALIQSKSGQTYESLQWAGENLLTLGAFREAGSVFERIMKTSETDPAFLGQDGSRERLLRTRLGLAATLRGMGDFAAAETLIGQLLAENPKSLEPRVEKAHLIADKANAGKASWRDAFDQWRSLALQLGQRSPKPLEYYDSWYHAAIALMKQGKGTQARQTLSSVMRLSTNVGGPEMKAKYQELLGQIK